MLLISSKQCNCHCLRCRTENVCCTEGKSQKLEVLRERWTQWKDNKTHTALRREQL